MSMEALIYNPVCDCSIFQISMKNRQYP